MIYRVVMRIVEILRNWPNGNRREHYFVKNGRRVGVSRAWYENSLLRERVGYDEDPAKCEEYYMNGNKSVEYYFRGWDYVGEYKRWYETGEFAVRYEFGGDGVLNGVYEKYYRSGEIYERFRYERGKIHGGYWRWDRDGVLMDEVVFEYGEVKHVNVFLDDMNRNIALGQGEIVVWKRCRYNPYCFVSSRKVYVRLLIGADVRRGMCMGEYGYEGRVSEGKVLEITDDQGNSYPEAVWRDRNGENIITFKLGETVGSAEGITVYRDKVLCD